MQHRGGSVPLRLGRTYIVGGAYSHQDAGREARRAVLVEDAATDDGLISLGRPSGSLRHQPGPGRGADGTPIKLTGLLASLRKKPHPSRCSWGSSLGVCRDVRL